MVRSLGPQCQRIPPNATLPLGIPRSCSLLTDCPLTVRQLLKLSETFREQRFTSPAERPRPPAKTLRCRLGASVDVRHRQPQRNARLLQAHAPRIPPAPRGERHAADEAILQRSRHCPSAPHAQSCRVRRPYVRRRASPGHRDEDTSRRENSLRLQVGQENLFPDCAFELHTRDGQQFNFFVELDNGTERVRSDKDADSWQRKVRLYEQLQDQTSIPTGSACWSSRREAASALDHILRPLRPTTPATHGGRFSMRSTSTTISARPMRSEALFPRSSRPARRTHSLAARHSRSAICRRAIRTALVTSSTCR